MADFEFPPKFPKQALSSTGVQVGEDVSARIQSAMRSMVAKQDARDLELKIAAESYEYAAKEEIWALVKVQESRDGTKWYSAETVDKVVGIRAHVKTDRPERTVRGAQTELRFKIAKLWAQLRIDSQEGARARAAKIIFRQAILGASDSAGQE